MMKYSDSVVDSWYVYVFCARARNIIVEDVKESILNMEIVV